MRKKMSLEVNKKSNLLEYSAGWISIIVNTLLFAAKFWVGSAIGSTAIMADAWHTLSDSLTSVVVLIGIKVSSKPADEKHPFGHGRVELISSIIIGIFLFVVAFNFFVESISNLRAHRVVTYNNFAVVVFIVSTVVKEVIAQYAFWIGKKTKSRSIIADGWHHRSDATASAIILVGMLAGARLWWIDGILAIVVSIFISYAAYSILRDTISPLIGEKPEKKLIEKIDAISRKTFPADINLHHFHIHRYGKHIELTFHIKLSGDINLQDSHNIARRIEELIETELGVDATIHVETLED